MAAQASVVHSTFRIEREYPASPARVFSALADPATKRRWFVEGNGSEVQEFTLDFRVGGREATRFRFKGNPDLPGAPPAGTEFRNDTVYQDIVPDRRIVLAYTMAVGGRRISASLATVEIVPEGDGTRLTFTEQGAFFEGSDGPELGEPTELPRRSPPRGPPYWKSRVLRRQALGDEHDGQGCWVQETA